MIQTVGIAGLGLLGTSLGMALRGKGVTRIGWTRNQDNLKRALDEDVIDEAVEPLEGLPARADLTVLCLPVNEIVRALPRLAPLLKPGAILTDVGSAKGLIMEAAKDFQSRGFFIGSHPMAGTEYSGYDAGVSTLYEGAPVFVTPRTEDRGKMADIEGGNPVYEILRFWDSLGAKPELVEAVEHDRIVAYTSHLPHVLSTALVLTALDGIHDQEALKQRYLGCAGGFRDTTRIASSSASMWRSIIEQNKTAVLEAVSAFEGHLNTLRTAVETNDFENVERLFQKGSELRAEWLENKDGMKGKK